MNYNDVILERDGSHWGKFLYEVSLSQNINQIAEQQVATANTATNATHVYQVIVQLAKQIGPIGSKQHPG